jgi:PAS domain S-box-containing protein
MRERHTLSPACDSQYPSGYEAIFTASPVAMWVVDLETKKVLAVNQSALDYLGQRQEHCASLLWALSEPAADLDGGVKRHLHPDGRILIMRVETRPIDFADRSARLVVVTDSGSESRALADRARALSLVDAVAGWVWECDDDLRFRQVSTEFTEETGLTEACLIGWRLDAGPPYATLQAFDPLAAVAERQRFRDLVVGFDRPAGARVWLELAGTPIHDREGVFRGYRGIGNTVTARVEAELTARRREQRYNRFFEGAPVWFWESDGEHRLLFISPNNQDKFGMAPHDYRGRRLVDTPGITIDPEIGRRVAAAVAVRLPFEDFVYGRKRPDGVTTWISTSGTPSFDPDGVFRGYSGIARDVTAQFEVERSLRDSERQYRELFETAADWYFESDADSYVRVLSPNYEAVTGMSRAESLGRRLYERPGISFDPDLGRMVVEARWAKRAFRDFIFSRTFSNGEVHWFKISATPILGPDGEFQGYRGIGAEITKSVEVEATARLAQRRLEGVMAYVTQPLVVFDHEDRAIAFNHAFGGLHRIRTSYAPIADGPKSYGPISNGVTLQAILEWELQVGFYADGPGEEVFDLEELLALHRSEGEHTYHLYDDRWMLVTYRRLPGDARVGLWSDVTAIKRAERHRLRLEEQLHHSQRLEALGTLAGGVAHEINNALVPVLALTQVVARKMPPDSRDRHHLDTVVQSTGRIRDLVRRILAFSRKEPNHRESVDVAAVLNEALEMMRATVPANIHLASVIDSVPRAVGDATQLCQVIVNLVTNAAQAIGLGMGTITVGLHAEPDGAHFRLWVSDTGCGMDEATRARIFEPFFTTKPVGEGTGLGLSVAHGIIGEHGGSIQVASEPGRGTRFDIILPALPPDTSPAA